MGSDATNSARLTPARRSGSCNSLKIPQRESIGRIGPLTSRRRKRILSDRSQPLTRHNQYNRQYFRVNLSIGKNVTSACNAGKALLIDYVSKLRIFKPSDFCTGATPPERRHKFFPEFENIAAHRIRQLTFIRLTRDSQNAGASNPFWGAYLPGRRSLWRRAEC
jgi:hypothetical protein